MSSAACAPSPDAFSLNPPQRPATLGWALRQIRFATTPARTGALLRLFERIRQLREQRTQLKALVRRARLFTPDVADIVATLAGSNPDAAPETFVAAFQRTHFELDERLCDAGFDIWADAAIKVAQRAGWPLRIAARKPLRHVADPNVRADWDHYNHDVKPLLANDHTKLIGEVGGSAKDKFLGNAAALVFPIRWPEPFGLVMVEALPCGTPVIALRAGSVPEVIEHGVTGFICDNEEEMVEAIGHIGELDRARCRQEAERRFSPDRMAEDYERVIDWTWTS